MTEVPGAADPTVGGGASASGAPGSPMSERMQALLSRAVEDQLSEQRQLTTALADIRALLVRLPQDVREATQAAVGAHDVGAGTEIDGLARELRAGLQALGGRLDALAQREQPADSALDARLAAVEAAVTRHTERLEQLAAQDHDELLSRLDALFDRVVALDERSGAASPDLAAEVRGSIEGLGRTLIAGQPSASDMEAAVRLVVPEAISAAHADTERRLAAHVDEAVLALAEALLRRRPARPAYSSDVPAGAGLADVGPGPVAAASPREPVMEADAGLRAQEPAADSEAEPAGPSSGGEPVDDSIVERLELDEEDEFADLADASEEEPPVADPTSAQPQGPQPLIRPATPPPARPAEEHRRKPWWRPGD